MNPQQPGVDAAHLHAAQSHQQLTHACRDNFHTDPPESRLLLNTDSGDPSRSAADPHPTDSDLKREEPLLPPRVSHAGHRQNEVACEAEEPGEVAYGHHRNTKAIQR